MPMTLNCPRCDFVLSAEDEDELVAKVQTHVRKDHGLEHTLPRKHILARLRLQPPIAQPLKPGISTARSDATHDEH